MSPFGGSWDSNPWSSRTDELKSDTSCFLARHSALLGLDNDWLAQYSDNVTEWGVRSWCWWTGLPATMRQHYNKPLLPVPLNHMCWGPPPTVVLLVSIILQSYVVSLQKWTYFL